MTTMWLAGETVAPLRSLARPRARGCSLAHHVVATDGLEKQTNLDSVC